VIAMPTEDEIKRKMLEQRMGEQQQAAAVQQQSMQQQAAAEEMLKKLMNDVLEPDARERLANVKMVKPELAMQLEMYLAQVYQSGQLQGKKISDGQLKDILMKITQKHETTIKRI